VIDAIRRLFATISALVLGVIVLGVSVNRSMMAVLSRATREAGNGVGNCSGLKCHSRYL